MGHFSATIDRHWSKLCRMRHCSHKNKGKRSQNSEALVIVHLDDASVRGNRGVKVRCKRLFSSLSGLRCVSNYFDPRSRTCHVADRCSDFAGPYPAVLLAL